MEVSIAPPRRKKAAADRRAQQLRSDTRMLQRIVRGCTSIHDHRGNSLSAVGKLLLVAATDRLSKVKAGEHMSGVVNTEEVHVVDSLGGDDVFEALIH